MFNRLNNIFTNAWLYKTYIKDFYYDFAKWLKPLEKYNENDIHSIMLRYHE